MKNPQTNELAGGTAELHPAISSIPQTKDDNGFDSNPYINQPNDGGGAFSSNTVSTSVADEINDADTPTSSSKKANFLNSMLSLKDKFKKKDQPKEFGNPSTDGSVPTSKKTNHLTRESYLRILRNIGLVLGIIVLILTIIRVPYFGAFIDGTIFSFLFGWAKYAIYAILLTALILAWFPRWYRRIFSKKKWFMYLAVILCCSIILSSVGSYVMNLSELPKFSDYFILDKTDVNAVLHKSYISWWVHQMWTQDMTHYGQKFEGYLVNYAALIAPNSYAYGGLWGTLVVAIVVYAAPAILIIIGLTVIVVAVSLIIARNKRHKKELSKFRKKIIRMLGGYSDKQENSEMKVYDVSDMKFSDSVHQKYDDMLKNQNDIDSVNVESTSEVATTTISPATGSTALAATESVQLPATVNADVTTELQPAEMATETVDLSLASEDTVSLPAVETKSVPADNEEAEEELIAVSNLDHQTKMLVDEVNLSNDSNHTLLKTKRNKFLANSQYTPIGDYEKLLAESNFDEYPQIDSIKDTNQDYWSEFNKELNNLESKINDQLKVHNLTAKLIKKEILFQSVSLIYEFSSADQALQMSELKPQLMSVLNVNQMVMNVKDNQLSIAIPTSVKSVIGIKDMLLAVGYDAPMSIVVGKEADRSDFYIRGCYEPRTIIYGGRGSGRAMLLSTMLLSLCYLNSPNHLLGYIIDTSGKSLKQFATLPHLDQPIINNAFEGIELLSKLTQIIQEQDTTFADVGVDNIYDYNLRVSDDYKIANTFVVINDLNDLFSEDSESTQVFLDVILENAFKHGIILLVSTSVVNAEVTQFDHYMDNIIVMKLDSDQESELVLHNSMATQLFGSGDMWLKTDGNMYRLQMPFVNREEALSLIKNIDQAFAINQ